jgi:putative ABC transport system permease protein
MFMENVYLALREIRRNALRSFLTILGIVVGVSAVITLVTLGRGATAQVTKEISSMGSNQLHIRPGQGFHGPGGSRSTAEKFTTDDAQAVLTHISGIEAVAPNSNQSTQAIKGNVNWSTMVTGTTNGFLQVRDWELQAGREFSNTELKAGKAVCILGATVSKELFGAQNPTGSWIRLEKLSCQVIGVLKTKGQSSFGNDQDDIVLIPIATFQRRIAGNNDVEAIFISVRSSGEIDPVKSNLVRLFRERRHIGEGKEDDFNVRDTRELINALTGTTRVMTTLLGAVAAISLLVGGIGIMNIMLVSVTERTREIGIRLAIGALEKEVLIQFLVEAVAISCFGGIVGIFTGLGASIVCAQILNLPFVLNFGIVGYAFLFSAAVGVIFGYFPARKAAQLNPIEALRHE